MLTSFFGKSAPLNYLLLTILVGLAYIGVWYTGLLSPEAELQWWQHLISIACLVFAILLVDFIIRKNYLTERHNYGIFIFSCLLLASPKIVWNFNVVVAFVFSMLAFRRIISLSSKKNTEKKLLDASIWIALAGFFYPYALGFILLLYAGMMLSGTLKFRYLMIPPIGIVAVLSILSSIHLLLYDDFKWLLELEWKIGLDFRAYNEPYLYISTALILGLLIWLTLFRVLRLKKVKRKQRPTFLILTTAMIASLLVAASAPVKDGSELLFVFGPLSMALAEYVQTREQHLIKEAFLWVFMLLPVLLILLQM